MYRYDGQNFKTFSHILNDEFSLPSDNIATIFLKQDGTIWVSDGIKGISKFYPVKQKFHSSRNTNKKEIDVANENITNIFQDSKGRTWMVIFGYDIAYLNKKNSLKVFSFHKLSGVLPWELLLNIF